VRTPASNRGEQVQAEVTREWVTYRQAEEIAGLSRTTLRKLVDEGEIRIKRVGRAVRINRESLDAYMRGDSEVGATNTPGHGSPLG
jgi:excisionase family DNA binding protein